MKLDLASVNNRNVNLKSYFIMGKFFIVCILVLHGALLAKGDIGTYCRERNFKSVNRKDMLNIRWFHLIKMSSALPFLSVEFRTFQFYPCILLGD